MFEGELPHSITPFLAVTRLRSVFARLSALWQTTEKRVGKGLSPKNVPLTLSTDGLLPEGMYKTGVDLPAGEYKVTADSMGYAEVSSNSSHDMGSIVSNDNFQGEKYITVKDGQYLKLTRAKIKVK